MDKKINHFYELDEDLQEYILSKVRNPQPINLQKDIINYKISKDKIFKKYIEKGYDYDINNEFYIYYQIENDLLRYYNDDVATMYGLTETNIEKLERILSIKINMEKSSKALVGTNIMHTCNINVNMRINMLIGCLTINEREEFISSLKY
tara:strand:+ start:2975 stop:3424 length:450 start_codon:yes stop_codon:yes gene_type:complete